MSSALFPETITLDQDFRDDCGCAYQWKKLASNTVAESRIVPMLKTECAGCKGARRARIDAAKRDYDFTEKELIET